MPTSMQTFIKKYGKLADEVIALIHAGLAKGQTAAQVTDSAMKAAKYVERVKELTLDVMAATVTRNGLEIIDSRALRNWWLDQHWKGQDLTLSQIINSNEARAQIIQTVSGQLKTGSAWTTTAKAVTDQQLVAGDISKTMTKLVKFARHSDARAVIPELRKAQRAVERLARAGAPTTRLKKAYQNIINVVERGDVEGLDKAVDRAVRAKARYNAERIARTEMSRANSKAIEVQIDADPDAVGYKSNLSSRHVDPDVCDIHAGADQYGMGEGVVPKNIGLAIPYHPNCLCFATLVYRSPVKTPKFNPDAGAKYLKNNKAVRQGVFSKRDDSEFKKNPGTWQGHTSNYSRPIQRSKSQQIPDRLVKV